MGFWSERGDITHGKFTGVIEKLTPPDVYAGATMVIIGLLLRRTATLVGYGVTSLGVVSLYRALQRKPREDKQPLPAGAI